MGREPDIEQERLDAETPAAPPVPAGQVFGEPGGQQPPPGQGPSVAPQPMPTRGGMPRRLKLSAQSAREAAVMRGQGR